MNKSVKLVVAVLVCGLIGIGVFTLFRPRAGTSSEIKKPVTGAGVEQKMVQPNRQPMKEQIVAAVAVGDGREGVTTQSVSKMRRSAVQMMLEGRNAEALSELLTCLNDTFVKGVHQGVRHLVLMDLAKLAEIYAPAREAMLDYRDAALELMTAPGPVNLDYATTFAWLNKALKDEKTLVDAMDRLPSADPRRQILGVNAFDTLVDRRRYADAVRAKGLANMIREIEVQASYPADKTTGAYKLTVVNDAAKNIEALAGFNKLDDAQVLINRVLAYDGSDQTKLIIKERLLKTGVSLDLFSGLQAHSF